MASAFDWIVFSIAGGIALMLAEVGKLVAADAYRAAKNKCAQEVERFKLWRTRRRSTSHDR